MSDALPPHDHDGPHEGPIKTPKQLILAVLYAFVVPVVVIVLLVMYATGDHRPAAGSTALTPEATALRIQPVGRVEVKDASDLSTLRSGEQVFAAQCAACHTAGLVGSPKFGDAEAWAPRIKTGYDALLHSALAGKGQMGAQGGGDYTDFEIGRAVVYMANKAGARFDEPKPPAVVASGADGPAAAAAPAAAPSAPVAAAAMPSTTRSKIESWTYSRDPATQTWPPLKKIALAAPEVRGWVMVIAARPATRMRRHCRRERRFESSWKSIIEAVVNSVIVLRVTSHHHSAHCCCWSMMTS